ncbi:MAG: HAD hydrolase-like protein [Candidatus Woesearchaeota archaeon]
MIIFDLDDTLYNCTEQLDGDLDNMDEIKLCQGVKEILDRKDFIKILVTKGDPLIQTKKIDLLGIRNCFDKIVVCENDEEKFDCFKMILAEFDEKRVWVVGNRVDSEIYYGNKLGLRTILIKKGKYASLEPKNELEVADRIIYNFAELEEELCKP